MIFEDRLKEFVRAIAGDSIAIRKNTPLFESGLIDSMRILDLIVLIEDEIGRRISDDEIALASFRTIDAICSTFSSDMATGSKRRRITRTRR